MLGVLAQVRQPIRLSIRLQSGIDLEARRTTLSAQSSGKSVREQTATRSLFLALRAETGSSQFTAFEVLIRLDLYADTASNETTAIHSIGSLKPHPLQTALRLRRLSSTTTAREHRRLVAGRS